MRIEAWTLLGTLGLAVGCVTPLEEGRRVGEPATSFPWTPAEDDSGRWAVDATRPGPTISRTAVRPKRFTPSAGPVEISFELEEAASEAEVALRSESGALARVLPVESPGLGRHAVSWDGTDHSGSPLPPGVYVYEIRARVEGGGASVWRDRDWDGAEVIPLRFSYDSASRSVRYVLPRAGRVRLRAGLAGLPFVATLLDWEPQAAGRHELAWDGHDGDRVFDVGRDPRAQLMLHAFELPADTIVLDRGIGALGRGEAPPAARGFRHARHAAAWCRDFRLQLELPELARRGSSSGLPVVSDEEVIRVKLDPSDARHLVGVGFEILVFVDTVFLFQEAEASNPFNYRLDSSQLSPGPHVLTVNVLSTDDHAGFASLAFLKQ